MYIVRVEKATRVVQINRTVRSKEKHMKGRADRLTSSMSISPPCGNNHRSQQPVLQRRRSVPVHFVDCWRWLPLPPVGLTHSPTDGRAKRVRRALRRINDGGDSFEVETGMLVVATSNKANLFILEDTVLEYAAEQPSRRVRTRRRHVARLEVLLDGREKGVVGARVSPLRALSSDGTAESFASASSGVAMVESKSYFLCWRACRRLPAFATRSRWMLAQTTPPFHHCSIPSAVTPLLLRHPFLFHQAEPRAT